MSHLGKTVLAVHLAHLVPLHIGNNAVTGRCLELGPELAVQEHATGMLLSQGYIQPGARRLGPKNRAAAFVLVTELLQNATSWIPKTGSRPCNGWWWWLQ